MARLTNKAFLQKVKESIHSIDSQADVYLFGSRAQGSPEGFGLGFFGAYFWKSDW
ncbi:hypothetical protein [Larkinella rosea]|uniref:hypothetical protein n=1 Tax=Larkinella rosea TaxID=2025312 RepID=UPI001639694F|nr:hypothetical protein [Larkinella rosea]